MGAKTAGSVFWALLFPVAVRLSSSGCVTYRHRETCGLKGSSVEFPCTYSKNLQVTSISGWSKKLHPNMKPKPLKKMPDYLSRMSDPERGNSDCTMKLIDLKRSDASVYYFMYSFRNASGYRMTCEGVPGVRLHIFVSPVSIQVERLVRGKVVPVADWTVTEGETIMLTCVPTCAANLNSNPGYIWYKNKRQLHGSRANSPSLSLDPITNKDTGSYVCAMIGYRDLPSSAVSLRVQGGPRNTVAIYEVTDCGLKNDSVPTLTHGCDAQNSTDQTLNNCQTPKGNRMFTFSIMLAVSVCVGLLVIAIIMAKLVLKSKKEEKIRKCADSVPGPPNPDSDFYIHLDTISMSAEYNTLDTVRRCSTADTVYENLQQPEKSMG